jgi:hypothetical protein
MELATILKQCPHCLGTKLIEGNTCGNCNGSGLAEKEVINITDIVDKLPNATKLIYSYQIVEIINPTEYASLVDAAKDGLRIILSCGVLDLVHTGQIYANLIAIFGSKPITKAAIEAL